MIFMERMSVWPIRWKVMERKEVSWSVRLLNISWRSICRTRRKRGTSSHLKSRSKANHMIILSVHIYFTSWNTIDHHYILLFIQLLWVTNRIIYSNYNNLEMLRDIDDFEIILNHGDYDQQIGSSILSISSFKAFQI